MTCNNIQVNIKDQSNLLMSNRIFIPIQNKKTNRLSTCKFINRYRITRHLLHSGTLPLHFIAKSTLRNHSKMHSMILSIHRTYHKPKMTKSPIRRNRHRSKYNTLPTTRSIIRSLLSHEYNRAVCIRQKLRSGRRFIVYEQNFLNDAVLCWIYIFLL
jgi:cellulose biosynthesis protein BcsQ